MYKCLDCGAEFEEPRGGSSYDYIDTGIGMMAVADVGCCECPYCGGDYEEMYECKYCGCEFLYKDMEDIDCCKECYEKYEVEE